MDKRVVFLFGSGISIPAGYPSVGNITDQVLSGQNVFRHSDSHFYIRQSKNQNTTADFPERDSAVRDFVRHIEAHLVLFGGGKTLFNYEDIYSLLSQIRDHEEGATYNPALQPLINLIVEHAVSILSRNPDRSDRKWSLKMLCDESCNYIHDIVRAKLCKQPDSTDHLKFLQDAHKEGYKQDIFSLNHDLLIEKFLEENQIEYSDGFGNEENGVRYWRSLGLSSEQSPVHLYKLHGGVDWVTIRPRDGTFYDEKNCIISNNAYPYDAVSPDGARQWPVDTRRFLVGTLGKQISYYDDIYVDLHYMFLCGLRRVNRLVVCGYGFGDMAVTRRIVGWMYQNLNNHLIVIHPDPDRIIGSGRIGLATRWQEWKSSGVLRTIPKKVEELAWQDIEAVLV